MTLIKLNPVFSYSQEDMFCSDDKNHELFNSAAVYSVRLDTLILEGDSKKTVEHPSKCRAREMMAKGGELGQGLLGLLNIQ